MTLKNKVVVITGGSGQIGQATAIRLASQGARIFSLVRRDPEKAWHGVSKLPNPELNHQVLVVDVKQSDQVQQAAHTVQELAGRCDILVNSAAIALHPQNIFEFPDEQFDEVMAVNLKAPWLMTKAFYPMLKASGDGLVVNLSSVASVRTRPTSTFYSMSKAGLNAMTESLAKACGPEVRFVAIAPSMLPQPVSGYPFVVDKQFGPFHIDQAVQMSPVKRICSAEDVAMAIEGLATNMKFYNGHLLMLDGGATL
jgi:3-oxoacyl-[acyl-carrier protein] reductase